MKRRILLVDDEVAVLLTLKAVLEISGFEVDTAASGREGKSRLRSHEYHMVITDMRMESDAAGHRGHRRGPLGKLSTGHCPAHCVSRRGGRLAGAGAHKMLVKPMHTRVLLQQIEKLLAFHESTLDRLSSSVAKAVPGNSIAKPSAKKAAARTAPREAA